MTPSRSGTRSPPNQRRPAAARRRRQPSNCGYAVKVTFCVRGVLSPLLANCYFRRFLLAWHGHGHRDELDAHVVNYADDFVICCRPGNAAAAMVGWETG
jgi:hypothetical protein